MTTAQDNAAGEQLNSAAELKQFLQKILDRLSDKSAASVNALASMKWILAQPNIYSLLDPTNKEMARDIWLRIKQSGFNIKNPPILFSPEEI